MYSRTIISKILRRLLVSVCCLELSGCKYLELYRFSQQFCDLDEYIEITDNANSTNVIFNTPMLSRTLLLRYLGATPIRSRHPTESNSDFVSEDEFRIEDTSTTEQQFNFFLHYHELSKHSLLWQAHLDPTLSALFTPEFVRPIFASFCTDDYDIEDEYVDLRFQLEESPTTRPSRSQLFTVFGAPISKPAEVSQTYDYHFRFAQQVTNPAEKEISFRFNFDDANQLSKLEIKYYRYDYQLDFKSGAGRLVVSR